MDHTFGIATISAMLPPLAAILGFLMAAAWLAKRLRDGGIIRAVARRSIARPAIEILASRSVGLQSSLLLIESEGHRFLISAGRNGIQRIGRVGMARPPAAEDFAAPARETVS